MTEATPKVINVQILCLTKESHPTPHCCVFIVNRYRSDDLLYFAQIVCNLLESNRIGHWAKTKKTGAKYT